MVSCCRVLERHLVHKVRHLDHRIAHKMVVGDDQADFLILLNQGWLAGHHHCYAERSTGVAESYVAVVANKE